ncbi:hypothetical protein HPB52_023163 [Rhipicephalus sanguineus]|uniref:Uncharacterized protein n=1 Tax=Rhipicephalus sanguineus TaxID=34632 RepID=A0A9D4PZ30_RHISA|nr:hypothetical protein HPB52_023163 [Rhipicephalus sanguineus]
MTLHERLEVGTGSQHVGSQLNSKQQILWSLQELLLSQNSHKVNPTAELGYHKQPLHREEALFRCEEVAEQDVL